MARLIDTSVFIEFERQGHALTQFDAYFAIDSGAVSSVTAVELLLGVERADSLARRQRRSRFVESILRDFPIVPFNLAVARVHARVGAQMLSVGQSIGQHDLIIAATALADGYSVLTHNLRHFDRVPGLTVYRPDW